MSMKTKWSWSYETEALRIAYACANLANGFYQKQGFVVLPTPTTSPTPGTTIYLPNMSYTTIKRFWETVTRIDFTQPHKLQNLIAKPLINPLISRLKLLDNPTISTHPIQKVWDHNQEKITRELLHYLNLPARSILSITIHPSQYGSVASYEPAESYPADLIIYLRQDQGIRTLVNVIVQALLTRQLERTHSATWKQIKFLSDWIVSDSPLSKLLAKLDPLPYQSGVKLLSNMSAAKKIINESHSFLSKIGAPQRGSALENIGGVITYKSNPVLHLTTRERSVLSELIKISPEPLSYESIGDLIFNTLDEYSLTTINKVIQHLRDKLERNSIPASMIKTIYGQGYALR